MWPVGPSQWSLAHRVMFIALLCSSSWSLQITGPCLFSESLYSIVMSCAWLDITVSESSSDITDDNYYCSSPVLACYQLQRKDHLTTRFLRVLAGDPTKPCIRGIPDASSKLFFLPLPLSLTDRTLSEELPFTAGRKKASGLERCLTCSGPSGSCVMFTTSLLAC